MEQGAPQPEITTQPGAAPLRQLRLLRWRLHRLWCLPESYRVFTPAFAGLFLLTVISLGLTAASWVMVRLLPNQCACHGNTAGLCFFQQHGYLL